ncbi:hypothetical protein M3Y97_00220800 [Aphelenchoides bicaudatus]|nr:hypothetical protein M3Y97_00220800 [Aphelenchoides bicaudatus]
MVQRIHVFLGLFAFVSYLETIGSTYTISAVQSIERQFQIPSKLSGFLLSAHELSYIPSIIFVSYYGSKGNRAKWISAGALIIAGAQLLVTTSNFAFPTHKPHFNLTEIEDRLRPEPVLLENEATLRDYFNYALIRDRIPSNVREEVLAKLDSENKIEQPEDEPQNESPASIETAKHNESSYQLDEPLILEAMSHMEAILKGTEDEKPLLEVLHRFVENRLKYKLLDDSNSTMGGDLKKLRKAAVAPFSFCNRMINDMRYALKELSCQNKVSNFGPLLIIFFSMLILGVGRTMPWALGIPLIDDNSKKKDTPVFFAVISFIKILGPICGFLLGSIVNKLYFTFPTSAPVGLTTQDPQWIGAWWLGYLFIGCIMIIPSLALFFFPESSGKKNKIIEQNGKNGLTGNEKQKLKLTFYDKHKVDDDHKSTKEKFMDFFGSYRNVLQSKVYVASVFGRVLDVLAFKGYLVFLPKFLENHYGIPQYRVHTLMAAFGVFGFACGAMSGGFIMRRFKLTGRHAALFLLFVSAINTTTFVAKSFFGCHSTVNSVGLAGVATNFNYTNECNSECSCEHARLFPVCDKNGRAFYSPCQAGCRHVSVVDPASHKLKFTECNCADGGVVKKEYCIDDCKEMAAFFFIAVIIGSFAAGCGMVPGMLILLRSVPPSTRSISLGLQGFLVSLIGTLPSPILWGIIIDGTCLLWDQACGTRGACVIYEPSKLRVRMHLTYAFIRLISTLNDLFVFYHAKGLTLMDEDEERKNQEEVVKESIQMNTLPE